MQEPRYSCWLRAALLHTPSLSPREASHYFSGQPREMNAIQLRCQYNRYIDKYAKNKKFAKDTLEQEMQDNLVLESCLQRNMQQAVHGARPGLDQ